MAIKMNKIKILAALYIVTFSIDIYAKCFKSGMDLTEITACAENNDVEAQLYLAEAYYYGVSVKKNFEKSAKWIKLASSLGSAEAKYKLGVLHYEGLGVMPNSQKGAALFKEAHELGYLVATCQYANVLTTGEGVDIDDNQAVEILKKVESNPEVPWLCISVLAKQYFFGCGVEKDDKKVKDLIDKLISSPDDSKREKGQQLKEMIGRFPVMEGDCNK